MLRAREGAAAPSSFLQVGWMWLMMHVLRCTSLPPIWCTYRKISSPVLLLQAESEPQPQPLPVWQQQAPTGIGQQPPQLHQEAPEDGMWLLQEAAEDGIERQQAVEDEQQQATEGGLSQQQQQVSEDEEDRMEQQQQVSEEEEAQQQQATEAGVGGLAYQQPSSEPSWQPPLMNDAPAAEDAAGDAVDLTLDSSEDEGPAGTPIDLTLIEPPPTGPAGGRKRPLPMSLQGSLGGELVLAGC